MFKISNQIPPNSIEFQTLNLPRFFIQILYQILKSSNKESCSLLHYLLSHILFENFHAREVYLLIESVQTI
jgi:hypothetical protein